MREVITESLTATCGAELAVWAFPYEQKLSIDVIEAGESLQAYVTVEQAEQHIQHVRRAIAALREMVPGQNVLKFVPGAARSADVRGMV